MPKYKDRQEVESQTMLTHLLKPSPQTGLGSKQLGPTKEGQNRTALWEVVAGRRWSLVGKSDHFLCCLPSTS